VNAGRAILAEALGSALLLATVVGSGIMGEQLAAGNAAIALLANSAATVAALFVLITLFAAHSGAHFNPAVTLILRLRGNTTPAPLSTYVVAQVAGAVAGVFLAHAMFDLPLWQPGDHVRNGSGQLISEGVATFGLVLTILLGACHAPRAVPALVACWIGAAYWFTASTSFANPAVTVARALTRSFAGIAPADAPAFVVAQFTGALLAWCAARVLLPRDPCPAPQGVP
jgi:glycerol uptake facilitator-like aquaporin